MARSLLLLVVSVAAIGVLVLLAFRLSDRDLESAPCAAPDVRPIAGTARELAVGDGIWSAWLTYPPRAGDSTTVLWRIEGAATRPFSLEGRSRAGRDLEVSYGPSPVLPLLGGGGFPWERGGREWGSRLVFAEPGCWRVRVEAGGKWGQLEVSVRGAPPSGERLGH